MIFAVTCSSVCVNAVRDFTSGHVSVCVSASVLKLKETHFHIVESVGKDRTISPALDQSDYSSIFIL